MAAIGNGHHIGHAQDCLLCADATRGPTPLCAACLADLPRAPQPACPHCARPSPTGSACGACLRIPPHFDSVRAAFRYTYPFDRLLQDFKYGHRLSLAPWLSQELTRIGQGVDADRIVPLPLHAARLRQRGFNQTVLLARPLAAVRGRPLATDLLERRLDTPPQAEQALAARHRNVRGAFHCNDDLSGCRILLVDDVMTSGATLDEAARTLKLHGAVRVDALVLARALPAQDT
ncbi:MAG: ComF family protein [Propionivibrio sp.]